MKYNCRIKKYKNTTKKKKKKLRLKEISAKKTP